MITLFSLLGLMILVLIPIMGNSTLAHASTDIPLATTPVTPTEPTAAEIAQAGLGIVDISPPTPGLTEGNAILKNFTMQFSNKTNATLVNYVMSQEDGNAMVVAINLILSGEDYEVPEPLEEEPLEEESSSSNSDSSDSEESGPLRTAVEK